MMRVTNQIMTNNTLANINTNKLNLMKIEEQYETGKKIQRPSDDPVVGLIFRRKLGHFISVFV